jgi:hypothetical protein
MTAQETIMADLESLPATAPQSVADFVQQMRQRATEDRQAAFDASFGCMTKDEADEFDCVIEEGCERISPEHEALRVARR